MASELLRKVLRTPDTSSLPSFTLNEEVLVLDPVELEEVSVIDVICNTVIIGSGNGLVPDRHQAITWTNVDTDHWNIYEIL